jgi:serine phosphatase RsbU (regulator of sigma subunit)/HAMP domain-containing protein
MNNFWIRLFKLPLKLGFFQKISVHIVLVTLLTGIVVTAAAAYQYRRAIYELEYSSVSLVFGYTASYLTAHYRNNDGYILRSIDYGMRQRFQQPRDNDFSRDTTHLPRQLVLYDRDGEIIYELRIDDTIPVATAIAPHELPQNFAVVHQHDEDLIIVSGPVLRGDDHPGFLVMHIPTTIRAQLRQLLLQSSLVLIAVLAITILMSLLFTKHALLPIRALTSAARAVHRGDPFSSVPVMTDDEVGELTQTFNDLTRSMDHRMDFMHRMQEWTVRIGRQLDTKRLFELLGEMFERMSTAESYRLYLQNNVTGELDIRLEYGSKDWPAPEQDSLAKMALKERWTMYLKSGGISDNEPTDVLELAIPLLSGKNRVGVIRIGRRSDRALYDDDTLTILQTLAQHASVAIDNASLYERLAAQERMAQEMTLARQIQQSMLPKEPPPIPNYEVFGGSAAALEVGGDYFDYITQDRFSYLLIGDVSGKGVPAALIMSIVRALIHTYLEFETAPRQILQRVNRSVTADLDPEMFVTMTMLQLDPVAHRLVIARAGHEPVFVVRHDGEVARLSPAGTALGMLEVEEFDGLLKETARNIEIDDVILLYTDGITEAQNSAQEEFGYERLEKLLQQHRHLSAKELYAVILNEVTAFSSGLAQLDDITLLILKRTV